MVRTDILYDRKCIHVKLKKESHLRLREKLFSYELSIQAVFDEFAELIVNEDKRATKIIEDLVIKKAQERLGKAHKPIPASPGRLAELDHNTLYSMINTEDREK